MQGERREKGAAVKNEKERRLQTMMKKLNREGGGTS